MAGSDLTIVRRAPDHTKATLIANTMAGRKWIEDNLSHPGTYRVIIDLDYVDELEASIRRLAVSLSVR